MKRIQNASFLVFPSICYEGCPMTLIEAMALGKPVIATDLGPRSEMVRNGYNGFLYQPNDVITLREKALELIKNRELRERMGSNARKVYLANYTPELNYSSLMNIYETAIKRSRILK